MLKKFNELYNHIIFQQALSLDLLQDVSINPISEDLPIFQNLDIDTWKENVLDYPFYFKPENVTPIAVAPILTKILLNDGSFCNLINYLKTTSDTRSQRRLKISNNYREYSSILLLLDLLKDKTLDINNYKNTEYSWFRYTFNNEDLKAEIYRYRQLEYDYDRFYNLVESLVKQSNFQKIIPASNPGKHKLENIALSNLNSANVDLNKVLTIQQFNLIQNYNREIATRHGSRFYGDIIKLLNEKPDITLLSGKEIPTLALLLTFNNKNQNIKNNVYPYIFHNSRQIQNLIFPSSTYYDIKHDLAIEYKTNRAVNILVYDGSQLIFKCLKELWNFGQNGNAAQQKSGPYPTILNQEFKLKRYGIPKYIQSIVGQQKKSKIK